MELAISHRLLESGLFADGQRLAICGPLRMERSYDARFATSPTDPGRPDWTTRLEVLTSACGGRRHAGRLVRRADRRG